MTDISQIWKFDLRKGGSPSPREGACLYQAAHWIAEGRLVSRGTDDCPVIWCYAIPLHDTMPHDLRQKLLKPFILRVAYNRDPKAEPERMRRIVLETARRVVPLALGERYPEDAARLRALPDDATCKTVRVVCNDILHDRGGMDGGAQYALSYLSRAAHRAFIGLAHAAADPAVQAANCAASGDRVERVWREAAGVLDGALRIGRQSPAFEEGEILEAVRDFDRARAG